MSLSASLCLLGVYPSQCCVFDCVWVCVYMCGWLLAFLLSMCVCCSVWVLAVCMHCMCEERRTKGAAESQQNLTFTHTRTHTSMQEYKVEGIRIQDFISGCTVKRHTVCLFSWLCITVKATLLSPINNSDNNNNRHHYIWADASSVFTHTYLCHLNISWNLSCWDRTKEWANAYNMSMYRCFFC